MTERPALRIVLRAPTLKGAIFDELREGEALLLGREPDPARVPPEALPAGRRVRAVTVSANSVSGNHCLVWREGDRVELRDLGSRNGTLAPLGSGGTASVAVDDELVLELAPVPDETPREGGAPLRPKDAAWDDARSFPEAVAREVGAWLALNGLAVKARVLRRGERSGADGKITLPPIPLLDDVSLQLTEEGGAGTINPLWGRVIETVVEYAHDQCARLRRERGWGHGPDFVMASSSFREAHRKVAEAAERGMQLILLGETGAGKGTLAHCYHSHSARSGAPFESVNCAEVDKHFARTRLFGAKKGAYTGCHADQRGVVELARGGTLFLDEVAELPSEVQGELLTFLDDQRYKRFGDESWLQADVRLVCGTNVDLRRAVRDGRFRADLWYRLAGRVVEVPPLRERREDLIAFLKARALDEASRAASVWDALSPDAQHLALEHTWRGNFRELAGFVRRLPRDADVGSIDLACAREALDEGALDLTAAAPSSGSVVGWDAMATRAAALYRARTQLDEPAKASDFREYVEDVLKPLFFARALGMDDIDAVPERPSPSFEEMARRMGCDASTIKVQLARYVEIRRGAKRG